MLVLLGPVTRNTFGAGTAWYVSTKLDGGDLSAVLLDAVETAGIVTAAQPQAGLAVATRGTATDSFTFLINHAEDDAEYPATGGTSSSAKPSPAPPSCLQVASASYIPAERC